MNTILYIYKRAIFWSIIILIVFFLISDVFAAGDITPDFMTQEKDAESSIGKVMGKVFTWLLYAAAGLGAIAAAYGLGEVTGVLGDKAKGFDRIKTGLTVVAVSGIFLGIVSFFAQLGN